MALNFFRKAPQPFQTKVLKEIPIGNDAAARYVPWIIGLMVFLLSLLMAGAFSMSVSLHKWQLGITNKLTVEIPLQGMGAPQPLIQKVLAQIQSTPNIAKAEVVDSERLRNLLEPWVGHVDVLQDLNVPVLIDVEILPDTQVNLAELKNGLRKIVAGARIEAHSRWQETLVTLKNTLQFIAYFIAAMIVAAVMVTIVLITRSGFVAHREIVDVLRLLGASNDYIARHFQRQAFYLSFKGGIIGTLGAIPAILFLNWLGQLMGLPEILKPDIDLRLFIVVGIIPVIVAVISVLMARVAVMRTLTRLG